MDPNKKKLIEAFQNHSRKYQQTFYELLVHKEVDNTYLDDTSLLTKEIVRVCEPFNRALFKLIQKKKVGYETLNLVLSAYYQTADKLNQPKDFLDILLFLAIYTMGDRGKLSKLSDRKIEKTVLSALSDLSSPQGKALFEDLFVTINTPYFKPLCADLCEVDINKLFPKENNALPQVTEIIPGTIVQVSLEQFLGIGKQSSVILTINEEVVIRGYYDLYCKGVKYPTIEEVSDHLKLMYQCNLENVHIKMLIDGLKHKQLVETCGLLSTRGFELLRG